MFDIFAKLLSSIASFLFPLFASYKALKTSDPGQLTPWLMYWVVLACALLVESWTEWILVWIPFYAYLRLLFLLYLVLPQTQGARLLYQSYIHPWLEDNETTIEDFIASAHERLRAAGIAYIKRAIELLKTNVLGLPPTPETAASASDPRSGTPQSYTQTLLARFTLPSARWNGSAPSTGAPLGSDFYSFLASAVNAAASAATTTRGGAASTSSSTATLIPDSIRGAPARMSFIQAQRERLAMVLSALDREATALQSEEAARAAAAADGSPFGLGGLDTERLSARSLSEQSGLSGLSGLTKSRSEADFEKLEAESGEEEEMDDGASMRKRTTPAAAAAVSPSGGGGSWMPWGWGGSGTPSGADTGRSSGVDK
ncbi:TB2/DP1, HVA22 family-domain-containing protein [Lasiosphaeris hirsuta]|uniref:Protein YOP1 n=1 Tax=Lasiosphaeris hirsuta TaxID=260670 RepID=A0AA40A3C9_9PEZI|nr:TB2/DP1, HVA22 family-domain-containing protein [Lasiosphaeris hirsuta]